MDLPRELPDAVKRPLHEVEKKDGSTNNLLNMCAAIAPAMRHDVQQSRVRVRTVALSLEWVVRLVSDDAIGATASHAHHARPHTWRRGLHTTMHKRPWSLRIDGACRTKRKDRKRPSLSRTLLRSSDIFRSPGNRGPVTMRVAMVAHRNQVVNASFL